MMEAGVEPAFGICLGENGLRFLEAHVDLPA